MDKQYLRYSIPDSVTDSKLLELIQASHVLVAEPVCQERSVYHDSFDWRLYLSGGVLEEVRDAQLDCLEWRERDSGNLLEQLVLTSGVPSFTWDIPSCDFRTRLEPILEMRALLPRLLVDSRIRRFRLFNEDEKTVLHLYLEQNSYSLPDAKHKSVAKRSLRLLPVRGYDRALQRMRRFLRGEIGLTAGPPVLLQEGLVALGRQPVDYTSKLNFRLDPKQRADEAAKEIHLHLLNTMEANIPGTRAGLDSEFLHDLRVAVRRARSALTQIKGVFMPEDIEQFISRLAWVGQITGLTRDMDVYLLGFDRYQQSLPAEYRSALEPLYDFLQTHHKSEQQAMVRKINSPHFRKFFKEWREFLEAAPPRVPLAHNAIRQIHEIANKRIDKIFRRVLKEGLAINQDSPADDLHELRKSCKKLRYLMEFFQSLYPQKQLMPIIKVLKKLLNNLGDFQDMEVQASKLKEFAHQMVEEQSVPADTLLAMGMLVDDLLQHQGQAREEFADRFAGFATKENRIVLRKLFSAKAPRGNG